MASVVAHSLPPVVVPRTPASSARAFNKFPLVSLHAEKHRFSEVHLAEGKARFIIAVKAVGESSEASSSLSLVESVQNVWDKSEDRLAVIGLGFAAVVALWASANLVSAIDKLPVLPGVFELVGILYSSWFVYRNLLFKPDREELYRSINKSVSDVLGQ